MGRAHPIAVEDRQLAVVEASGFAEQFGHPIKLVGGRAIGVRPSVKDDEPEIVPGQVKPGIVPEIGVPDEVEMLGPRGPGEARLDQSGIGERRIPAHQIVLALVLMARVAGRRLAPVQRLPVRIY